MDRKQIVKTLEKFFKVKAKYLGAPTFVYQIGTKEKTYTIDRIGKIITDDGHEVALDKLLERKPQIETKKEKIIEYTDVELLNYEIKLPMEEHNGKTLRNLTNMIYSKQALIKKSLGLKENLIEDEFTLDINEVEIKTLDDFKTILENLGKSSCPGIKFDFTENTLTFNIPQSPKELGLIIQLFALINKNAKKLKYASAKLKPITNEKYSFRTYLIRLGMIGDEYKKARKVLLKNLSGNGAYK